MAGRVGTITALDGTYQIGLGIRDAGTFDIKSVGVVVSGTWTATLTPQISLDDGNTWVTTSFFDIGANSSTPSVTVNGSYLILRIGGATHARVKASLYTSGTIEVYLNTAETTTGDAVTASGVLGPVSIYTPNADSAMDETNDAVRVNVVAGITADTAHDDPYTEAPVGQGTFAVAHGANPTGVTAGDKVHNIANRAGVPFVIGGHPNVVSIAAAYTAAQDDTAIITVGAGTKIVVTQIQFTADNANTVDVGFYIGFATANTPTTTGVVLTHPGVAPGSGISRGNGDGILGIGADGEDLRIDCEVPTTGSVRVLVTYYTIES